MSAISETAAIEGFRGGESGMTVGHALRALRGIAGRELFKFTRQYGRLGSAVVRPLLWLVVFAAGMSNQLGISPDEPYTTYVIFQVYIIPGLVGVVILFNGMQSSLSLVYDREVGTMRLLLTAPLPRWYLLFCKVIAGTILSVLQGLAFLAIAFLVAQMMVVWGGPDIDFPWKNIFFMLPAMFFAGFLLGSIGLLLSVYVRQLENFAGTMNFVIFPMFFLSSALYPLWRLRESGAEYLYYISSANPFHHAVEIVRYAAYGKVTWTSLAVVIGTSIVCFILAALAYDPQRGLIRRRGGG